MKLLSSLLLVLGIFVKSQFTYPNVSIPDPLSKIDFDDEKETINSAESIFIKNNKLKEFSKKGTFLGETHTEIKKLDIYGNITYTLHSTELPADHREAPLTSALVHIPENRKSEYKTVSDNSRIVSFYSERNGKIGVKTDVSYNNDNQIIKTENKDETNEYFYENGLLTKILSKEKSFKRESFFTCDSKGKLISIKSENTFPNGQKMVQSNTFKYDAAGNLISNLQNSTMHGISEKKYVYQKNKIVKYTHLMGNKVWDERLYEYNADHSLKKITKNKTDFGIITVSYKYADGFLTEKIVGNDKKEAILSTLYFYDDQGRLIRIDHKQNNVINALFTITHSKNKIAQTGLGYESVYTFYE
ncbi:hypothetical protein ASG31_05580 [Chryseobacterium sp. Leaf404]|uniref:hypothetical protein n=1 Tax=unclassified Chryseobacterium TaxID=2593645 RepID=UPI0006F82E7C|nr:MULTISPECIES: hypothetical protein [unclassified Chryseobacterium]KQT18201.1 hypothetical protein ASG31_05580 [Chryseobacterium sp. Leaf404]